MKLFQAIGLILLFSLTATLAVMQVCTQIEEYQESLRLEGYNQGYNKGAVSALWTIHEDIYTTPDAMVDKTEVFFTLESYIEVFEND